MADSNTDLLEHQDSLEDQQSAGNQDATENQDKAESQNLQMDQDHSEDRELVESLDQAEISDLTGKQDYSENKDLAESPELPEYQGAAELHDQDLGEKKKLVEDQDNQDPAKYEDQELTDKQELVAEDEPENQDSTGNQEQDLAETQDKDLAKEQPPAENQEYPEDHLPEEEDGQEKRDLPDGQADLEKKDDPMERALEDPDLHEALQNEQFSLGDLPDLPHNEFLQRELPNASDHHADGLPESSKETKESPCAPEKAPQYTPPPKAVTKFKHSFKPFVNKAWNRDPKIDYEAPMRRVAGRKRKYNVTSLHLVKHYERSEKGRRLYPRKRLSRRPVWHPGCLHPKSRPEPCRPLKPVPDPTKYQDVKPRYLDWYQKHKEEY